MAKKSVKKILNYTAELKELREHGPERLYYLYGPEEFLRERYVEELAKLCVPDDMGFSRKKLDGANLGLEQLREAVNSVPFFTGRTMVEVRDFDINKCRDKELERLKDIAGDVPDYCTLVFIMSASYEPDGRTSGVRFLSGAGKTIEFTEQGQDSVAGWIINKFSAAGKRISISDAQYLMFLSGSLLNGLAPEIDKIAAYSRGDTISREDIDKTANRIPEAKAFDMVNSLLAGRYNDAADKLGDLYYNEKDNHPIMLLALIGSQIRRMLAVKLCIDSGADRADIMEACGIKNDYACDSTLASVRKLPAEKLADMAEECAEFDYKMKSSSVAERELLEELFARIAVINDGKR